MDRRKALLSLLYHGRTQDPENSLESLSSETDVLCSFSVPPRRKQNKTKQIPEGCSAEATSVGPWRYKPIVKGKSECILT